MSTSVKDIPDDLNESPPRKAQKIKLRLYKHPVKLDAKIVEMAIDGQWMKVEFDGPLPSMTLWKYSESLLSDRSPNDNVGPIQLYEVL